MLRGVGRGEQTPTVVTTRQVDDLVVGAFWLARLVVDDVASRAPRSVDRQDLHSAALVALVSAARIFDPSIGVPFAAFARTRMRWAVVDELRAHDPLSRGDRRRVSAWRDADEEWARRRAADRHPSAHLPHRDRRPLSTPSLDRARAIAAAAPAAIAVDAADPTAASPELHVIERELVDAVRCALHRLPPRCRAAVTAHFIEGREMRVIADELGVTASRVSQLCAEGVRRLRTALAPVDLDTTELTAGIRVTTSSGAA